MKHEFKPELNYSYMESLCEIVKTKLIISYNDFIKFLTSRKDPLTLLIETLGNNKINY